MGKKKVFEVDDLWGDLPEPKKVTPPINILKKQVHYLAKKVDGKLSCIITERIVNNIFQYDLILLSPATGGMEYHLLKLRHNVEMYASEIEYEGGKKLICMNEKALLESLKEVLSGKKVRGALSCFLTLAENS